MKCAPKTTDLKTTANQLYSLMSQVSYHLSALNLFNFALLLKC